MLSFYIKYHPVDFTFSDGRSSTYRFVLFFRYKNFVTNVTAYDTNILKILKSCFTAKFQFKKFVNAYEIIGDRTIEPIATDTAVQFGVSLLAYKIKCHQRSLDFASSLEKYYNFDRDNVLICTDQAWGNSGYKLEKELQLIKHRKVQRVKLKLLLDEDHGKKYLETVSKVLGKDVEYRLDLNGACESYEDLNLILRNSKELGLKVTYIEDPFKKNSLLEHYTHKMGNCAPKLMLDSNIRNVDDLLMFKHTLRTFTVNIKLNRLGDFKKILMLIDWCDNNGIDYSFGCADDILESMRILCLLAKKTKNCVGVEGAGSHRMRYHGSDHDVKISDGLLIDYLHQKNNEQTAPKNFIYFQELGVTIFTIVRYLIGLFWRKVLGKNG